MPRTPPRTEIPIKALILLEYLVDRDAVLTTSSTTRGGGTIFATLLRPTPERPRPGGRHDPGAPAVDNAAWKALWSRGAFDFPRREDVDRSLGIEPNQVADASDKEAFARASPFAWYEQLNYPNAEARRILEASRGRLAAHRAAEAERVDEFVVARRGARLPGVGALCRVVERTARRLFVDVVAPGPASGADAVGHYGDRRLLSPDDVLPIRVTRAAWGRLVDVTSDYDARVGAARRTYEGEVAKLRLLFQSAEAQARAELEDAMREILPRHADAGAARACAGMPDHDPGPPSPSP